MATGQIEVTSHVARDFLQNADYFNSPSKVVWEYVSNSLDACEDKKSVSIEVQVSSNEIRISDDGPGMSREELHNFFTMHGENQHRKQGKRVRGKFGTGKCAAFGLANYLKIETVKAGKRNVVELRRNDIERASDGTSFPVNELVNDEPVLSGSFTRITIRDFNSKPKNSSVDKVRTYVEKHLGRNRQRSNVYINDQECRFKELPYSDSFEAIPDAEIAERIGDVSLIIKVSPFPLAPDLRGVDILSHRIWHETTLAEIDSRKFADRLFGEVDVPLLEDYTGRVSTFDNTRNNSLNRANPVVVALLAWLSQELEKIRSKLEADERKRRRTKEAQELAKEAQRIAEILNLDFAEVDLEMDRARNKSAQPGLVNSDDISNSTGDLLPGSGEEPTPWQQAGNEHGNGTGGGSVGPGDTPRPGPSIIPGDEPGSKRRQTKGNGRRRRATFSVEHENTGVEQNRSRYDRETKTIFINLDFPWIAAAFEAGNQQVANPQFQQICFEVATVEYALAIPFEKIERNEYITPEDPLYDVGETINRVMRRLVTV